MKIGIIVAMDKEFVQLKALLENATMEQHHKKDFAVGNIGDKDIVIQKCGIGKVNSAIGAVEMINNYAPDLVISTGVAGGADVEMNVTDVIVGTSYCYHDAYCGSECSFGQIIGMPPAFTAPKRPRRKSCIPERRDKDSCRSDCQRRMVCRLTREDAGHTRQLSQGQGRRHGELLYSADLPHIRSAVRKFPHNQRHTA